MLNKILTAIYLTILTLTIFLLPLETRAAWGDFDSSFGSQGVTVDTVTGYFPRIVAIQHDGKILVTGYNTTTFGNKGFFLRRYLSNGQLDMGFGTNGAASGPEANSATTNYRGEKIVVQTNGKIAVAGMVNGFYGVWQFLSNGKRDTTFGVNGLQILWSYPTFANTFPDMNIQNGKLLLTLRIERGDAYRVALIRLTSSGAMDGTFGTSGESLTDIHGGPYSNGTVVDTNGKITVGGYKFDSVFEKGLDRKLANGQNDPFFFSTTSNSIGQLATGLVKLANGKYTLRSFNLFGGSPALILDKFSSNGVFESTPSYAGWFLESNCPDVFANQNDGKILVQFASRIFRLNSDLDFGAVEVCGCSNLIGVTFFARAAIQADDKMVVAGISNDYLTLMRLLPN